ncbi:MAG: glycosyltransferase family 8 protein [Sulfuricurvum sp.]|uniref:glycosyltransferase family 8 protein n=1 Tax=Sulfuricurvum sp. TaxID=2025608 RepID=UPI00262B6221|nr:glycosyltransferase family 8 protein [Sulfuricurvum sp.]MDD2367947.1 glycosyltransferase family 8 protein [Sulfuricurvum sp.]MDD2950988.1 glycosyltransferase family 8 protein [Sulfuricurvum sp.]MDD5117473.1 glycosyltransferase family 8 protein [Sulfuricurvum sp.]
MDTIHIAFGCDDNYVKHLSVALLSLLEHADPLREIVVHVMIVKLSKKNKAGLRAIVEKFAKEIEFLIIDASLFEKVYLRGHILSPVTYARVLIPDIIDVGKVLYLDCDMLIKQDISQLYDVNIEDWYLMAVREPMMDRSRNRALGMPETAPYFNSGMLLINCNKWREDNIPHKVLEFASNEHERMFFHDQDALNVILQNKWKLLHPKWNQIANIYDFESFIQTDYSENEFEECLNNPYIIHFTWIKPDSYTCKHPSNVEYGVYLLQTPWAGALHKDKLKVLYKEWRARIKQKRRKIKAKLKELLNI